MAQSSSTKKVANGLVAVSAAAVLAVYAAGYARTRSAADQLDAQTAERRPGSPEGRGPAAASPDEHAATVAGRPDVAPALNAGLARETDNVPRQVASLEHAPVVPSVSAGTATLPASSTVESSSQNAESVTPVAEHKAEVAVASVVAPTPVTPAVVSAPVAPVVAAAPVPAAPAAPKWKDGTYTGWGTSRHGDIQAQVVVEAGRIQAATIAQCLTRYSCDVIGRLPPEVAQRQSAEVDYVSGATQSTNAFYYAVIDALSKAK
jgi:uncharacterized protein with FMN-binding domain